MVYQCTLHLILVLMTLTLNSNQKGVRMRKVLCQSSHMFSMGLDGTCYTLEKCWSIELTHLYLVLAANKQASKQNVYIRLCSGNFRPISMMIDTINLS